MRPYPHQRTIDYRKHPEKYLVARGEQGVLTVEPYKSEILPLWKFRTPEDAKRSSEAILKLFRRYVREGDFVGMDMARKFLQMGYTRARRYANHRSGKKYIGPVPMDKKGISGSHGRAVAPLDPDPVKAESAAIFKRAWEKAEAVPKYARMKKEWKEVRG